MSLLNLFNRHDHAEARLEMITKYADDTFVEKYDFTLNDGTNFSLNSLKEFTHEKLMKTIVKTDRVTVHLINNQSTTIQL